MTIGNRRLKVYGDQTVLTGLLIKTCDYIAKELYYARAHTTLKQWSLYKSQKKKEETHL